METIDRRRSIRAYTDAPVEKEKLTRIVAAAMQAPSANDQRPWEFVVITKKATIEKLSRMEPVAPPLELAPAAIALIADTTRLINPLLVEQDMAAATYAALLETVEQGLGGVWIGIPTETRKAYIREVLAIPERHIPFSIIALGYSNEKNVFVDRFDAAKLRYET